MVASNATRMDEGLMERQERRNRELSVPGLVFVLFGFILEKVIVLLILFVCLLCFLL